MDTIAFLGNYLPRQCGIATFTHDLRSAVISSRENIDAPVAMVTDDLRGYEYPEEVQFLLSEPDRAGYTRLAREINDSPARVLSLQHEFGIFGGPHGSWLLDLLRQLSIPVVTTCHTVLRDPSPPQRLVMSEIARHSSRLVVMAEKGREFLTSIYGIPATKIDVIPHGIPDTEITLEEGRAFRKTQGWTGRRVLLTFGLLAPSKGIEHAIRALPEIVRRHPDVLYVVVGATHPNLLRSEGELYRGRLQEMAAELGVADHLQFINRFVSREELVRLIAAADIYTTPYCNEAQITSGTLAYAFGLGKPVISTPYWHAAELLADNRGLLVPFRDSEALAAAAVSLLDNDSLREELSARAYEKGRSMTWTSVGQDYHDSFDQARRARRWAGNSPANTPGTVLRFTHLQRLMGPHGLFQHARLTEPDPAHGYCCDDNARAVILMTDWPRVSRTSEMLESVFSPCMSFLLRAYDFRSGRFRNFMDDRGTWLEKYGSEDSHGRALWALGHAARHHLDSSVRDAAVIVFRAAVPAVLKFTSPRSWAFALLGITDYLEVFGNDQAVKIIRADLCARLMQLYQVCSSPDWPWFEDIISYDNARVPQALLAAGRQTNDARLIETALESLSFLLAAQSAPEGHFRAIGCEGFWKRGGEPAQWDQQPLEALAMTSACLEAAAATGNAAWLESAQLCHSWFLGSNDLGLPVADPAEGGCHDGLHRTGLNLNQGAESTLAWLQGAAELQIAMNGTVSAPMPDILPAAA